MEEYEARVQSLTEQLNHQLELHRELAHRAKRYETDAYDLDSKLRSAEGELAAGDVLREGFKSDKEKVSVWMVIVICGGFFVCVCACVCMCVIGRLLGRFGFLFPF